MKIEIDSATPIYLQIAESIEDEILIGALAEGEQVPSTNQFAQFFQINPATAGKGINLLVDQGILYKKRGIGMFVATGAKNQIKEKRKKHFSETFLMPMMKEALKLGIPLGEIIEMLNNIKGEDNGL